MIARKSALIVSSWRAGVVAGCLVLEVAQRSGAVAGGDPGDIGETDGSVGARIDRRVLWTGLRSDSSWAGSSLAGVCTVPVVGGRNACLGPGREPAGGIIASAAGG